MTDYTADDLKRIGAQWIDRIRAVEDDPEHKAWWDDATEAETAYLAGQTGEGSERGSIPAWNIVASNVETIVPSIYNSTPIPDIRSRHDKKDPVAEQASDVLERAISMAVDDGRLDGEMEALAQDAFLSGRGILRLRFDADVQQLVYTDETGAEVDAGEQVTNERLVFESVSWRDYREGPAKKWRDVPWVAFRHCLSMEEIRRLDDEELPREEGDKSEGEKKDQDVWEIWCRETGRVYFVSDDKSRVYRMEEDPLGLPSFFPIPQPVQPICGTGRRIPVCPFAIYRKQAEELDRITRRINKLLEGLKAKGAITAAAEAVQEFAEADDNTLTAVADLEGMMAVGGIDKAIAWWPVQNIIAVLKELYVAREQIKQSIYEITGISDIIRGQGRASETATAQQIKTEWGSLRIKKMQRLIERQVRDVFVMSAEIMAMHFSPEALGRMAGMEIAPEVADVLSKPLDHYRIDVESDSTVRADTSQRREEMARFLEGTSQFFATMAPLVQQSPQGAAPVAEIYGAFATQFRLGKRAEDSINQLVEMAKQMAQQPQENPAAAAQQMQAEMEQAKMQSDMQVQQLKAQVDQMKAQADLEKQQMQAQIDAAKMALEREKLQFERDKLVAEREKLVFEAQVESSTSARMA